jgi:hypothetical protein
MKPAIIYTGGDRSEAHLVDLHSARMTTRPDEKTATHFPAAVFIADLCAGELHTEIDLEERTPGTVTVERFRLLAPRPCVYAITRKHADLGLGNRNLDERAAVALLQLARAANAMNEDTGRETWSFGEPVERGGKVNWDQWRFIAAWSWSHWQRHKIPGALQWEEMKRHGYPYSPGTLRKMLADIGLVTTRGK